MLRASPVLRDELPDRVRPAAGGACSRQTGIWGGQGMSDEDSDEDPRFKEVIDAVLRSVATLTGTRQAVTLEQLEAHRSERDLWVVIAGHVFDISGLITGSYGKRHPGTPGKGAYHTHTNDADICSR